MLGLWRSAQSQGVYVMTFRFLLVNSRAPKGDIKVRSVDNLRGNLREDDPARKDDHLFALALLESVSCMEAAEDITLNVLENGINLSTLKED